MPDLKDKYSDPELDRSNKAFDELVNQPDNKAFGDQMSAIARDLDRAEKEPDGTSGINKEADAGDVKQAEDRNSETNRDGYYDQKPEKQSLKSGSGWNTRRRIFAAAAGGSGVAAIIAAFMTLLPMKVPGLLSLITDNAAQRVEQITEKRAKLILGRAILTKFGTHSGVVLTGEGAFKTLVASMRTSGFEKRLAAKGLTITQTPDGVKLNYRGESIGDGKTFKNEKAIVDALEGNKVTNRVLKDVIKEDVPAWRWMKRAKFAKWLRIKYGIPRYGLTQSDADTQEERNRDYDKQRVTASDKRVVNNFFGLVKCMMSGSCDQVDATSEASKTEQSPDSDGAPKDVEKAAGTRIADVAANGLTAITEKMPSLIMKVFGSKAIPIIGWIDLVATIDHVVYSLGHDDFFGKLVSYYRGASYAAIYADWAGFSSQIQLGAMETPYVGKLAAELDGAEGAITFPGNNGKGTPIEMVVGSSEPTEVSKAFRSYTESDFSIGYRGVFHPVMNFYYEVFGADGFLGWVSEGIGWFLTKLIAPIAKPILDLIAWATPDDVKNWASSIVTQMVPWLLNFFGLSIDSFERGAKLFNNITGGAEVSWNQYAKERGFRRLTDGQAAIQNATIAQERAQYRSEKGLAYQLFSTDEPTSLSSQFAYRMPSTPSATVASIGTMLSSAPTRMMSAFIPPTFAAQSNTNLFKIALYGATAADMDRPLSDTFLSGGECPENSDDTFNDCAVDKEIAEAMLCEFDSESEDCSDQDPASTSSDGVSDFNIATYNTLGSSHSDDGGNRADELNTAQRMPLIIDTLKQQDVSIVGFQEFENTNRQLFLQGAGDIYDVYPQKPEYGGDKPSANSIAWRKADFEFVRGETRPILYFDGNKIEVPVVRLKNKASGQEIYFANTHDPANTQAHPKQQQYRLEDAKRHIEYFTNLYNRDKLPIFFTGDFNSSFDLRNQDDGLSRSELTYCVLTESGLLRNSYDVVKNRDGVCPTRGVNYIDHIYVSKDVKVTDWRVIKNASTGDASDHYPFVASIDMGGEGGGTEAQNGWAWPLGKQAWEQHRADFLGSHYNGGGFLGVNGYSDDISWGETDTGSPIYSMLDGIVEKQPLGRDSYNCKGSPNVSNNGGMIIKSTLNGHSVRIAYAHGSNPQFSAGQPVKAGQQILKLGSVGNSCGSHLHMDITYDGKGVCPQDVFLSLDKNMSPDLGQLVNKASIECLGRK